MRRGVPLRGWALVAVVLLASCGKDDAVPTPSAGGSAGASSTTGAGRGGSGGTGGAGTSGGAAGSAGTTGGGLVPCPDRPTDLARPPSGQLPCELLPPGFKR